MIGMVTKARKNELAEYEVIIITRQHVNVFEMSVDVVWVGRWLWV
jgi:hypothetical protein